MKKKKPKLQFKTEIVTGTCGACNLNTLLVGIDSTFYRCISYKIDTRNIKAKVGSD